MPTPFINRELSWLEFNQRVLNEALDSSLPLLDRFKFLAISASNLDEFFQVRVGGLMAMKRGGIKKRASSGHTPTQCLAEIRKRVLEMSAGQYQLLNEELLPALSSSGIQILEPDQLDAAQLERLADVFDKQIQPLLTPLAVHEDEATTTMPTLQLTVACRLRDTEERSTRHVLIPIPDTVNRFIAIEGPGDGMSFIKVEDVIALHAGSLFPEEQVRASTTFRLTRNSDIVVDDRDATNLAGDMEDALAARRFSFTARLEIDVNASRDLQRVIRKITHSSSRETYTVDGPIGLSDFMSLAFLEDFDHLRSPDWTPQQPASITPGARCSKPSPKRTSCSTTPTSPSSRWSSCSRRRRRIRTCWPSSRCYTGPRSSPRSSML